MRLAALLFMSVSLSLSLPAGAAQWGLQLPGMSQHFERPRHRGAEWNQRHEGVGLQRTVDLDSHRLDGGWVWRESAGFMLDSYGNQSAYVGAQLAWRQRRASFDIDTGLAPMLLYRTIDFDSQRGEAPLRLIPALLPVVTVEHRASGIGANIIAVPGMDLSRNFRLPGLVFLQFTRRIE